MFQADASHMPDHGHVTSPLGQASWPMRWTVGWTAGWVRPAAAGATNVPIKVIIQGSQPSHGLFERMF